MGVSDKWPALIAKAAPLLGAAALLCGLTASAAPEPRGESIGLVITAWHHALEETPGVKAECPAGLTPNDLTNASAQKNFSELKGKYGGGYSRGPNGEISLYVPEAVQDPLPFSELQTKVGHGVNLDGTQDGRATPRSCQHAKFTSPDGVQVDNQMARVFGCTKGWRTGGFLDEFFNDEISKTQNNRILIEITGVDSETNDPAVEVSLYKGADRLVRAATGKFIPNLNQRVDARLPEYTSKTRGRIENGVLITEAIPLARLPLQFINTGGTRKMRDLQLRIKLEGDYPQGILAGYEDLKSWWNNQKMSAAGISVGEVSPATVYRVSHRYADGYPDPTTGQCTAISAAYRIETVRANIAHPTGPGAIVVAKSEHAR